METFSLALVCCERGSRTGAGPATPGAGLLQPPRAHARRDPSRGAGLPGRPKANLARSPGSRHHPLMPPTPSPTYERLRDTIARRMRMSHIY